MKMRLGNCCNAPTSAWVQNPTPDIPQLSAAGPAEQHAPLASRSRQHPAAHLDGNEACQVVPRPRRRLPATRVGPALKARQAAVCKQARSTQAKVALQPMLQARGMAVLPPFPCAAPCATRQQAPAPPSHAHREPSNMPAIQSYAWAPSRALALCGRPSSHLRVVVAGWGGALAASWPTASIAQGRHHGNAPWAVRGTARAKHCGPQATTCPPNCGLLPDCSAISCPPPITVACHPTPVACHPKLGSFRNPSRPPVHHHAPARLQRNGVPATQPGF